MANNSWRDRPEPNHLDVNSRALSPGSANKRLSIQLPRGQSIKNSVGADPQAKNYGPKGSLLTDNFGGDSTYCEHSLDHRGAADSAAPRDQGTHTEGPDFVPPIGGGRK
jgi:hypothetical protein